MIVYHGSTGPIERPDTKHSYRALDFGPGFYVTSVREQAVRWARRKADLTGAARAVVSRYDMGADEDGLRVLRFGGDMEAWIDFVCRCRDGEPVYRDYDLIVGRVADDKVFRVVDMYHAGIWDKRRALQEIRAYEDYDQMAFITQTAIDRLLTFDGHIEV